MEVPARRLHSQRFCRHVKQEHDSSPGESGQTPQFNHDGSSSGEENQQIEEEKKVLS